MKKTLASIIAVLALSSTAFAAANYKVEAKTPTGAKKGTPTAVRIHIEGASGSTVNTDYPIKIVITPPAGVTLTKSTLTQADAAALKKTGADFDITFTSADAGAKAFTGEVKFATVSADGKNSAPATEKLSFSVDVK